MRITLLLIFVFTHFCFSQSLKDYRIGCKLGPNFSHIVRDESSRFRFNDPFIKLGITFGLVIDKTINENTSIQGEILYNQVGSRWGKSLFGGDLDYAIYNLEYISIPVYYKFKSRIGNLFTDFDFLLGISYSYNISAKQEVMIESNDELDYGPDTIRDEINVHEFGILTGIKIPFYKQRIFISIQYYWAITDIYQNRTISYPDELQDKNDFKNRNLSITFDFIIF